MIFSHRFTGKIYSQFFLTVANFQKVPFGFDQVLKQWFNDWEERTTQKDNLSGITTEMPPPKNK